MGRKIILILLNIDTSHATQAFLTWKHKLQFNILQEISKLGSVTERWSQEASELCRPPPPEPLHHQARIQPPSQMEQGGFTQVCDQLLTRNFTLTLLEINGKTDTDSNPARAGPTMLPFIPCVHDRSLVSQELPPFLCRKRDFIAWAFFQWSNCYKPSLEFLHNKTGEVFPRSCTAALPLVGSCGSNQPHMKGKATTDTQAPWRVRARPICQHLVNT